MSSGAGAIVIWRLFTLVSLSARVLDHARFLLGHAHCSQVHCFHTKHTVCCGRDGCQLCAMPLPFRSHSVEIAENSPRVCVCWLGRMRSRYNSCCQYLLAPDARVHSISKHL